MSCEHMRDAISALLDDELEEPRRLEVVAHIDGCIACRQVKENMERVRHHLAQGASVSSPPGLSDRIRATLEGERTEAVRRLRGSTGASHAFRRAAALLLLCGLSAAGGWVGGAHMASVDAVERDVVASHMRALIQETPIQVASNNTHNVKPWFAGRVEFSPSVKDLSAEGFELSGGRLDYMADRRVGVVVYKSGQHWIDVYSWPVSSPTGASVQTSVKGYNLVSWTHDGLVYWAISDLNKAELARLKDLL